MKFKVLILNQKSDYHLEISTLIKKYYKNIDIQFLIYHNHISLECYNLIITDIKLKKNISFSEKIQFFNKNIIYIITKHENLIISNMIDYIFEPLDFNNLVLKIQNTMNIQKDNLLNLKEKKLFNDIINNISEPFFLTDGSCVIYANTVFCNLLSCSSIEEMNEKYKNIGEAFKKKKGFIYQQKNNSWLSQYETNKINKISLIVDKLEKNYILSNVYLSQNKINMIFLNDITQQLEFQAQLSNSLFRDDLTKLPNRTKLINKFQNEKLILKSIALIDIKEFREINDFFGNSIGDKLLIGITQLISKYCNEKNNLILYKFPPDIYCLTNTILSNTSFLKIIKQIINEVYFKVFNFDNHEIDTRIVVGISFSTNKNKLITASFALQAAKKDNKSYIVFYDELDNMEEYKNNILWAKKLKYALNNNKIVPYFQAIVDNKTLEINKYECLVRMIDKDKIITPYFFIDISKKTNQYIQITQIMIEKSFEAFDKLPYEFSINISYEDIENDSVLECIKTNLEKYDVKNKVVFEILENQDIKNYDILIEFINKVKKLGCKVAIDDFGTGYSNFEKLLKMNIDYLKIDASIIKNIANDKNSYKIAKTITEFAKNLHMKTIAEFVENEAIFKIVKNLKIDYSQGYYFSEPISKPNVLLNKQDIKKGRK